MERFTRIFFLSGILLVIAVSVSGCSDSPESAVPDAVTTATTAGPLYTSGDIVRSASGSESPAWLVVGYDAGTDSYSRALIYKNTDGTYGYRTSPATETSKRSMLEKVYTVKITHVTAASVPTAAPVTATTATATTKTTTAAAGTATTTASAARPSIKAMSPEEGEAGTTVITEITGKDLMSNLTAMLRTSGQTSITASKVSWYSSTSVTLTFDLPNTTKVGTWDIVVTNPNGQSTEIANYFMVRGNGTED